MGSFPGRRRWGESAASAPGKAGPKWSGRSAANRRFGVEADPLEAAGDLCISVGVGELYAAPVGEGRAEKISAGSFSARGLSHRFMDWTGLPSYAASRGSGLLVTRVVRLRGRRTPSA
ncbi:hypothetical protein RAJCM14343_2157 [Rhodococcus aetherivorans]|uniref:Uncharacterized protein n=1 Tax=Rhodococcus aetherivorans TaxID=191292 RepID=A0ABQ0YK26_9NOCA|nr:hypothetical protein RAJCM14343_2157 [Rhodococcus aetherivorans]